MSLSGDGPTSVPALATLPLFADATVDDLEKHLLWLLSFLPRNLLEAFFKLMVGGQRSRKGRRGKGRRRNRSLPQRLLHGS